MGDILQTRALNEAYTTAKNVFDKKEIHLYPDVSIFNVLKNRF